MLKEHSTKTSKAQAISEALDKLNEISLDGLLEQFDAAKEWVKGLKDSLPLLKASDELSNKMKIMKGIMPSINGGSLITGITQ